MKPWFHAKNSARMFGGTPEDYMPVHNFLDESKAHHADVRHRALLHNTFGIWLAERVFGTYIVNSEGNKVQVRDIAEKHVLEDLGTIPAVTDYLKHMQIAEWFGGRPRRPAKKISLVDKQKPSTEVETNEMPIED